MILFSQRSDFSRRRSLLAFSLVFSTHVYADHVYADHVRADDGPANRLRNARTPAALAVQTVGEQPKASTANQIAATDDSHVESDAPISLVSDGWNARQAINQSVPLVDPVVTSPSYVIAPEQTKTVDLTPHSTLKFVVPETRYARSVAPASPSIEQRQSESETTSEATVQPSIQATSNLSLHALYGPGEPVESGEPVGAAEKSLELLPPIDSDAKAMPVSNPEANEPELQVDELGSTDRFDEAVESMDEGIFNELGSNRAEENKVPLDAGPEPEDLDDKNDLSASEFERHRIKVRDLILDVDKLADPPFLSKTTKANPVSSPGAERQSVGDEPVKSVEVDSTISRTGDRIEPNGDLIFALGMNNPKVAIAPSTTRLRVPIERVLNYYWSRPENSHERTHWGMFHAMMVYDKDTQIIDGKRRYNAVAWMAGNNPCRNDLLFEEDRLGINVKSGIGLQGHQAQMLAVFGLIDVPAAYPLYVGKKRYTVQDVIKREMLACKSGSELSFTLIGLAHYIDSDSTWVASDGKSWDFEKLIQEELAQPVVGSACGGTHRLMGFAHALRRRRAEGKPMTGQWARAETYMKDFITYTWQLQNRDGSMSTAWFEKSEDNGKVDRKIQTTGHMIEFLLTAVSDDQLQSPQMIRAVNFLATTLYEERGHEWSIGPKGHALRALAMYYQRVFGRQDPWRPLSVARTGTTRAR